MPLPASQRGYKVRALSRSGDKVQQLFGGAEGLSAAIADLREPSSLPEALEGVDVVVCATGTTAFPSKRCAAGLLACWLAVCCGTWRVHAEARLAAAAGCCTCLLLIQLLQGAMQQQPAARPVWCSASRDQMQP